MPLPILSFPLLPNGSQKKGSLLACCSCAPLPPGHACRSLRASPAAPPCAPFLLLPSLLLPPLVLPRPSPGARPRLRQLLGGGLPPRRRPLVAGPGRLLVAGDGGTSSTVLQRYFLREPRRSVMDSRRIRFLPFFPKVRLTVRLIFQSKYLCLSLKCSFERAGVYLSFINVFVPLC